MCAELHVGILKNIQFPKFWDSCAQNKTSEIPKMDFQELWISCAQNKTSEISKNGLQEFWDSCALNKRSHISNNALAKFLGLLCAEQNVGILKTCTFRNSSNQNKLRCLGQNLFGWDTPSEDHVLSKNHPKSTPEVSSGQPWAPSCSSRPDEETHFAT